MTATRRGLPPGTPPGKAAQVAGAEWPLAGRDADLARAAAAMRGAGGVLLAGPPGVGRTRLARELLREDRRRGRAGRWVGATRASRGIPLGAFAGLIGRADDRADRWGEGWGDGRADASRLSSAIPGIRGGPGAAGSVLVVDDAHLLDDVSAALLHTLALDRRPGDTALVVTTRSGEPAPDAVTALWKDELLPRHELGPLAEADTAALLEAVLGGPMEEAGSRRLHRAAQGNLVWLRHLVAGERAAGRLAARGGRWRWSGDPEITPPLADLIDDAIGELSGPGRLALELLAFGEPLGAELLGRLAGPQAPDELERRRLVMLEPSGRRVQLWLAHPLYADAVRARTGPLRARELRGRLAESLAGTGRRAGDTLRHAVLALDGDRPVPVPVLTEAAGMALSVADWPLAERLLRAAGTAPGDPFAPRLTLGLTLAASVPVGAAAEAADTELIEAVRLAGRAGDHGWQALATAARAVTRYFVGGHPTAAAALLAGRRPGDTGEAEGARAAFALAAGRLADAREHAARVPGSAAGPHGADDTQGSAFGRALAGWALVGAHALDGGAEEADRLAEELIAAGSLAPETAMLRFGLRYLQVLGLGLAGHPDRAAAATGWLRDLPGPYAAAARDATGGRVALDQGRVGTAATLLASARESFPGRGGGWGPVLEASRALALGMAGDPVGGRAALARAEADAHPGVRVHEPELALAAAWVAAAEGAVQRAVELAREAAARAAGGGQRAVEVLARHACVSFGDPGQADRLTELAAEVDGPRAAAAAEQAAALAADDPDALLAASDRLAGADLLLAAADAAAQAVPRYRGRGAGAQAAFAAARAAGLADRCDGARTPALRAGLRPLPISAREREVATLAALGLSNRLIAERLHVSVRTVEGHVYRACTRLGLPDRTALVALVADPTDDEPGTAPPGPSGARPR